MDEKKNVYSTLKIFAHPEVVKKLNTGERVAPLLIQFMVCDKCDANCSFCSYRREGNKNNEMFEDDINRQIPLQKMLEILKDSKDIGVKAFEITGGGEPSIYKYFDEMIEKMVEYDFDISIVSNGVLLTEDRIKKMSPKLKWARISIDAGTKESYMKIRDVKEKSWNRAWQAVRDLAKHGSDPEFSLGCGFVVTPDNYLEIVEGIKLMKENGAHNVRVSAAFTEQYLDYYSLGSVGSRDSVIEKAKELAAKAKDLYEDDNFKVFNLFGERIQNIEQGFQDYGYCMEKEVVCVIGGDQQVYTCCSLAFTKKGLIGSLKDISFKDLWFGEKTSSFFKKHNPRNICKVMCLYETRNKGFLENKDSGLVLPETTIHKNFI